MVDLTKNDEEENDNETEEDSDMGVELPNKNFLIETINSIFHCCIMCHQNIVSFLCTSIITNK